MLLTAKQRVVLRGVDDAALARHAVLAFAAAHARDVRATDRGVALPARHDAAVAKVTCEGARPSER